MRRLQKFGQQIETGGFAGTVRTDQGVDMATLYLQVDMVDGGEAFEILAEPARLENEFIHGPATTSVLGAVA